MLGAYCPSGHQFAAGILIAASLLFWCTVGSFFWQENYLSHKLTFIVQAGVRDYAR